MYLSNNLEILNLSSNQLTGEIPLEIGRLDRLTSLYLNDNQLTGFIPFELGNLTNLNSLRLNDNQLSGWFPSTMCNLPIEFDGTIVDSLNLPYFDISNNQSSGFEFRYASLVRNGAGMQAFKSTAWRCSFYHIAPQGSLTWQGTCEKSAGVSQAKE